MNVQEKMTMLKCYAYQKRESQGMEGKEAGMLEDWIDEEALAGEVTPEEIDQACRLSEYEIMYALRSSRKNRRKFSNGCII